MRSVSAIARYLAGVLFLVFGLNGFLNFIPPPPARGRRGTIHGCIVRLALLDGDFRDSGLRGGTSAVLHAPRLARSAASIRSNEAQGVVQAVVCVLCHCGS